MQYSKQQLTRFRSDIRKAYQSGELTEEEVSQLEAIGFDFQPYSKVVVCMELGRLFENASVATRELNLHKSTSNRIRIACRKGSGSAGGFHWRYATENEVSAGVVLVEDEFFGADPIGFKRPVVCRELGRVFESAGLAERELKLPKGSSNNIRACCLGKYAFAHNFHWRYATEDEVAVGSVLLEDDVYRKEPTRREKPVICRELGKMYASISLAERAFNCSNITSCCKGRQETSGGFHWRYATENEVSAGVVLVEDEFFGADPIGLEKPVVCRELGRLFKDAKEAAAFVNKPGKGHRIMKCCQRKTGHVGGYHWRVATDAEISANKVLLEEALLGTPPIRFKKPIVCTELARMFESTADAERDLGLSKGSATNIRSCCIGKYKSAYGYHWRYATEEEIAVGRVLEEVAES